jgi:hypothetical protein
MAFALSNTLNAASKPLRRAALSVAFALLSVWFVAASVASIHFEEQIAPLLSDATHAISSKSAEMSRGFSRLNALMARA